MAHLIMETAEQMEQMELTATLPIITTDLLLKAVRIYIQNP